MTLRTIHITISASSGGLLVCSPEQVHAGTTDDNNSIVLEFTRPAEFEQCDLSLFLQCGEEACRAALGRANSLTLTRAFTAHSALKIMPVFYGPDNYKRGAGVFTLSFTQALPGSEAPPEPWPDPWADFGENAWYGPWEDLGSCLLVKNRMGQELARLPKGDGNTPATSAWLPLVDEDGNLSWTLSGVHTAPEPQSIRGPAGPKGEKGDDGKQGLQGPAGTNGCNGATFTPVVDAAGILSWTNTADLANPAAQSIRGPEGPAGLPGPEGPQGAEGLPGVPGKSAYAFAVEGGYPGNEAAFSADLAGLAGLAEALAAI